MLGVPGWVWVVGVAGWLCTFVPLAREVRRAHKGG